MHALGEYSALAEMGKKKGKKGGLFVFVCEIRRGVCAIDTGGKKVDTDSDDEPKVVPQKKEEVKKPAPAAKKKKDTSAFAALAGSDEVISCAHTPGFELYNLQLRSLCSLRSRRVKKRR